MRAEWKFFPAIQHVYRLPVSFDACLAPCHCLHNILFNLFYQGFTSMQSIHHQHLHRHNHTFYFFFLLFNHLI